MSLSFLTVGPQPSQALWLVQAPCLVILQIEEKMPSPWSLTVVTQI